MTWHKKGSGTSIHVSTPHVATPKPSPTKVTKSQVATHVKSQPQAKAHGTKKVTGIHQVTPDIVQASQIRKPNKK